MMKNRIMSCCSVTYRLLCWCLKRNYYPVFNFFFFNDTATTEIYTLSLHDALPIWAVSARARTRAGTTRISKPHEQVVVFCFRFTPFARLHRGQTTTPYMLTRGRRGPQGTRRSGPSG